MTLGQFKVKGHATYYAMRELSAEQATDLGCAGSTHILESVRGNGHIVGTLTRTDRLVTVPEWRTRKGYRATFTPAVLEDNETLSGHAVVC